MEDVIITAGPHSFSPDSQGFFNVPLIAGFYEVTAELQGYGSITVDTEIIVSNTTIVILNLDYLQIPRRVFIGEVHGR